MIPKCPKCEGQMFVATSVSPDRLPGASVAMTFIHCATATCGAVVAVIPWHNTALIQNSVEQMLQSFKQQLDLQTNVLNELVAKVRNI